MKKEKADFIVVLEHEGGKKIAGRDNNVPELCRFSLKVSRKSP
jgi:hypothetical protein